MHEFFFGFIREFVAKNLFSKNAGQKQGKSKKVKSKI